MFFNIDDFNFVVGSLSDNLEKIILGQETVKAEDLKWNIPFPGCPKDELSVSFDKEQRVLKVKGKASGHNRTRVFYIPPEYNIDQIELKYKDGELRVKVPLKKKAEPVDLKIE